MASRLSVVLGRRMPMMVAPLVRSRVAPSAVRAALSYSTLSTSPLLSATTNTASSTSSYANTSVTSSWNRSNNTLSYSLRGYSIGGYDLKEAEPVVDIERDLHSLFGAELDRLESQLREFAVLKESLTGSGFVLKEREGQVILTRRFEDRNITLTWDPRVHVAEPEHIDPSVYEEEEEHADADQQQDDSEVQEEEEESLDSNNTAQDKVASDIEIDVRVESQSKTLVAKCAIAEDGLLYVYELTSPASEQSISLERVSQSLQHRVYDYLESLGIGDSLALFIRKYNQLYRANADIQSISSVNGFFKASLAARPKA